MTDFTIIIPHKNIPDLLKRCLDSIPDNNNIQIIVVDDNSSQDKVDFGHFPGIERQNVTCIFDKVGGGAGHARNIGLKHAQGKWIIFADADDFFVKDAFSVINNWKNENAQIIVFKTECVFSDTLQPSNRFLKHNKNVDAALNNEITEKEAVLNEPGPCAKMFRLEHIVNSNIRFDEVMYANDIMFVVKATCWAKKVKVVNDPIYVVTARRGSLTDKTMKDPDNYLCRMEVKIRRNKFFKNFPYQKTPILALVIRAAKLGPKTFCKALWMALKTNSLFSGFTVFWKKIWKRIFK